MYNCKWLPQPSLHHPTNFNPKQTHQLKGELANKTIAGRKLEQWQHDLTGSGPIWYCPDRKDRAIWVTRISLNHPQETG
jgi:hypothetical protein